MFRKLLPLVAVALAAPTANAQVGLNTLFGTGPSGAEPSSLAFSYHLLPSNPVARPWSGGGATG